MNFKSIAMLAAVIVLAMSCSSARADDPKNEILKIIPRIDAAIKANDAKVLSTIFDPDGHFVGSDGKVCNQKEYVAGLADPSIKLKTSKSNVRTLQVLGDTVLEMGTWNATGTQTGTQTGKSVTLAERYMSVWVKKNGKWMVTAEQCTKVPK